MLLAACTMLSAGPFASPTMAQDPTRTVVRTQDDLPRFTYPVNGTASALLTADDATFATFADSVAADIETMLTRYQIEDHATQRGLLSTKSQIEILRGRNADALKTLARIRALEDKPDAKLLSGLRTEAMLEAAAQAKAGSGPAFEEAYARAYAAKLAPLPWAVVGTRLKEAKASAQIVSADLIVGQAQANLDPAVAQSHQLSNELAWGLIGLRFALKQVVPVKAATFRVLAAEVAAKNVQKPDIWEAREVTLTAADTLTPVNVAIWDSGTDVALFPDRLYTDPHPTPQTDPHGIAFDLQADPTHGYLFPLTPEQTALYPTIRSELKGLSDLQLSIETPEADAVKAKFASLKPDQVPTYLEQLGLFGNYVHGTHVAGIAARGNPAIRLAVARITFDWKNVPDKPTEELARRSAAAAQATVDWFRRNRIRLVNMSWGGTPVAYEDALEKNGVGKDATERKALAKKLFGIERDGLYAALKSAPDILFVCAAGNADSDSGFEETMPAGFDLPNLLVVGAVDQAGDEASFTSYGTTVRAHASGYQVESYFPGGTLIRESGTSMASPNTVNLAAKLLALDPSLTPARLTELIVAGGTRSEDGRRNNIDPKRSVELLKAQAGR